MVMEDSDCYNIPNHDTNNDKKVGKKDGNNNSSHISDNDDDDCENSHHSLIRMEGTRRGKCNYVMVDSEDGEMVQCGNITRFRCKECSERAG
eukprot:CAMPEP_0197838704 /NCGR_PEP_ID=MMETSP1437-20131217/38194_1 /TAXON_ID=49252 ORGANISM="Eucampia antarctica, Strain CCMP1452" /NCGR_SAMPLE_ID=MMETSP1437 /ASSEMBLY_ACC=CAM_ASM_001096 /LENGTH=91 /DNA_ID=CAMNT_0043446965 /DNA_START=24 /DNA_END=295 /DNA_ORIENTATION=+